LLQVHPDVQVIRFDLLERLDNVPALIFTTAYDEFAVRAFEDNALELVTGLAAAPAAIS
jgi:DNA-binding LytR/AlgR family response regulator